MKNCKCRGNVDESSSRSVAQNQNQNGIGQVRSGNWRASGFYDWNGKWGLSWRASTAGFNELAPTVSLMDGGVVPLELIRGRERECVCERVNRHFVCQILSSIL